MTTSDYLRIIADGCSVVGSCLLALRVSGLLKALACVASAHESNINELSNLKGDIILAINSPKHVERAQRLGLLRVGFGFLIATGVLKIAAAFL